MLMTKIIIRAIDGGNAGMNDEPEILKTLNLRRHPFVAEPEPALYPAERPNNPVFGSFSVVPNAESASFTVRLWFLS